MEKYNGWTNYETWLVNLWWGDTLANMVQDSRNDDPSYNMAPGWAEDVVGDAEYSTVSDACGLVSDLLGQFMYRVNWSEIVEHANED